MEEKNSNPIPTNYNGAGIARSIRDVPPAHYTFKIESYSLLSSTQVEKYETGDFEAGGYKWRLSLYPNGNKKRNGNGYISLYLAISETDSFPLGWEVNVNFKLFVFDQIRDKYLTIQDVDGGVRRFHGMKTEWGFDQLISLDTFNDASNGYLLDDSCIFGAEVFVIKCTGKWECLSMVKEPVNNTYTWKIENFSALDKEYYSSPVFTVGERKWRLTVYPKGNSTAKGEGLSVFLELDDWESLPSKRKLYVEYKLRIRDQDRSNHQELTVKNWFCVSSHNWGFLELISLSELNQASRGFIKNDTVIVEGEIIVMSMVKDFS